MAGIEWTKDWSGADDGAIVGGIDLGNIQDDLSIVLTVADIGVLVQGYEDPGELVFWENDAVAYQNAAVYT